MKRILKRSLLVGTMILTSLGLAGNVSASNYQDTSFYFEFADFTNATAHTEDRPKYDNSSAYMSTDYVGGDYTYEGYVTLRNGADVSGGHHYTFNDGTTHFLINYAYEKYGWGTFVEIKADAGFNIVDVVAGGVWSPDSI